MTNRRERILAALKAAGPAGISGERVAKELQVSRVAVSKHITALRKEGYEIDARHGKGYNLISTPDLPLPAEVAPLVEHPMWKQLTGGHETHSTNDDARALARSGAPEGTVVLASRQASGRGRFGRPWKSPVGGVYLSVVLRPSVAPADLAPLPLVIALGVAFGLESLGASPRLKWPNDVYLNDGKLAGVLLEMTAEADCVDWVVAGVGLNVRPGDSRVAEAGYLQDAVSDVSSPAVAAAVLDGIGRAYEQWRTSGFATLHAEYEARHMLQGTSVTVRDIEGKTRAQGDVVGVDETGRLLVGDGEIVAVSSGDVSLKPVEQA